MKMKGRSERIKMVYKEWIKVPKLFKDHLEPLNGKVPLGR